MKKINWRNLHRDLGYFYIGLIVSFALSGIIQNHRKTWHPEKYTVSTKAVTYALPKEEALLTEDFAKDLGKKLGIAARTGNGHLCNQIRMAMENYQNIERLWPLVKVET